MRSSSFSECHLRLVRYDDWIYQTILVNLFRIAKIRKCLNACKTFVHSLVTSGIDYGNAVLYGISDRLLHRLDMVQRSAARVVLRIRRPDRLLVLVFRALHDRKPVHLASSVSWPGVADCSAAQPGTVRSLARGRPCGTRFPMTYVWL